MPHPGEAWGFSNCYERVRHKVEFKANHLLFLKTLLLLLPALPIQYIYYEQNQIISLSLNPTIWGKKFTKKAALIGTLIWKILMQIFQI